MQSREYLPPGSPPHSLLAVVTRSGRVESRHLGAAIGLTHDGSVRVERGDVHSRIYPRSVNKPFQATAMIEMGLPLRGHLLALASGSHTGQDYHVEGVREILAQARLTDEDLQCPPDMPSNEAARNSAIKRGTGPRRICMNCSGKHAAMLLTCMVNGWPTASYRDAQHPLQQAITAGIKKLARQPIRAMAIDGCGAPLHAVSLDKIAFAFRTLVSAQVGSAERLIADAIRQNSPWSSGDGELDLRLMAAVPGLLVKSGAEGVLAFAHESGIAGAIKIADGSPRPLGPVAVALLRRLGVRSSALAGLARIPVTGGSEIVGHIKAAELVGTTDESTPVEID